MNGNNKLDERQSKLIGEAMAISAVLILIYEVAIAIYMFNKTGNIKSAYIEIILIIAMFVSIFSYFIVTSQFDSSIEKGNKKMNLSKIDERDRMRIIASIGMAGFVSILYLAAVIIFKFIKTKSFESSYLQVVPLLIMTVTNAIYLIKNKEFNVPTTFFGKKLPLGDSKVDKKSRLIYYIKDAIRLSTVFLVFDIMNPDKLLFLGSSLDWRYIPYIENFIRRSIIFVIMDYSWESITLENKESLINH